VANAYVQLVAAQVRSQTQYRASFLMDLFSSGVLSLVDLSIVVVMFSVRGELGGFGAREVLLMVGIGSLGFSAADFAVGNVERLPFYVRTGLFDAVLVRPLPSLAQLVAMDFAPRRVGRFVQGLVIYVLALAIAPVDWWAGSVVLAVLAPLAAAVFFGSLFVAGATVAFWWIESGELAFAFTYGGREFASYPATVFGGFFRRMFAYGLGFAFAAYLPALALLGRPDPLGVPGWLHWCSPLVALLAAGAAASLWRTGVRHYRSTGS
jgi:viologen exporter family transport system permease protein